MAEEHSGAGTSSSGSGADLTSDLVEAYDANPEMRALTQLFPIGSSIDVLLSAAAEKIRAERARTFFDELARGDIDLSPQVIRSEDFLHRFFATLSSAERTHRRQKMRYLARLLRGSVSGDAVGNMDDYEELLSAVDELSYRELLLLALLAQHEEQTPRIDGENAVKRTTRFWTQFEQDAEVKAGVPKASLSAALTRLARSGFFEPITGAMLGYSGGRGFLTPQYYRLQAIAGSIADVEAEPAKR